MVNTSYFEIQYQGYLCDSWFTHNLPLSTIMKFCLKKLDESEKLKEYTKIAKGLLKDPQYKAVRILKVKKEVILEIAT